MLNVTFFWWIIVSRICFKEFALPAFSPQQESANFNNTQVSQVPVSVSCRTAEFRVLSWQQRECFLYQMLVQIVTLSGGLSASRRDVVTKTQVTTHRGCYNSEGEGMQGKTGRMSERRKRQDFNSCSWSSKDQHGQQRPCLLSPNLPFWTQPYALSLVQWLSSVAKEVSLLLLTHLTGLALELSTYKLGMLIAQVSMVPVPILHTGLGLQNLPLREYINELPLSACPPTLLCLHSPYCHLLCICFWSI